MFDRLNQVMVEVKNNDFESIKAELLAKYDLEEMYRITAVIGLMVQEELRNGGNIQSQSQDTQVR